MRSRATIYRTLVTLVLVTGLFVGSPASADLSFQLGEPPAPYDGPVREGTSRSALSGSNVIDTSDRQAVIDSYRFDMLQYREFVGFDSDWTGDVGTCDAGTINPAALEGAESQINWYRRMTGAQPIWLDETLNQKDQEAALIMEANNFLTHNVPVDAVCYTADGAEGALRSNISIGFADRMALDGYMADPGSNNITVGHRAWILNPTVRPFGWGATDRSTAMWVVPVNGEPLPGDLDWVAWPPAGYVPWTVTYPRWSLDHPDSFAHDFSGATVRMWHDGQELDVVVISGGVTGIVVWELDYESDEAPEGFVYACGNDCGIYPHPIDEDVVIDVEVSNVLVNGMPTTVSYTVTAVAAYQDVFTDVIYPSTFWNDIRWVQYREITLGCDIVGPRYCPGSGVTRAQMATFMVRAFDLPPVEGNVFSDVSGVHLANINAVAAAGITLGCGDGSTFCPDDRVTREQMASFMARALGLVPIGDNQFTDVDDDSNHVGNINAVAQAGITLGCGDGTTFCPKEIVTRAQMAAFLRRALGLG